MSADLSLIDKEHEKSETSEIDKDMITVFGLVKKNTGINVIKTGMQLHVGAF